MAPRVVLVSPEPPPPGARVDEWRREPRCGPGEVLLLHPRAPEPPPGCPAARVPHRSLLARAAELAREGLEPGEAVLRAALEALWEALEPGEPVVSAGRLRLHARPPPLLVWGNAYHGPRGVEEALRLEAAGAHAIVYSASPGACEGYLAALKRLNRELTVPLLADPAPCAGFEDSWAAGADGLLTLTPESLEHVDESLRRGPAWVLAPSLPPARDPRVRASQLSQALSRARSLGYRNIVLDPVAEPPVYPGALAGLEAARLASSLGAPTMLGAENIVELVDADSHGVLALLAALAAEAGVTALLVGEHSHKTRGAVAEAVAAAALASAALKHGTPPKDYPVRLLPWKGKGRGYP